MGRAIYCDFPTCTNECVGYCRVHRAVAPWVEQVAEHIDPENILTRSVVYANLMPMIRAMEEQWRQIDRLERQVRYLESEAVRNGH